MLSVPLRHTDGVQPSLLEETIGSRFATIVQQYPDAVAVKAAESQWTYRDLDQASDELALALRHSLGVLAGDRVIVSLGTNIHHLWVSPKLSRT
jgi:non-ribosomal peptide synthetase component E (peptide arylation enzyme)